MSDSHLQDDADRETRVETLQPGDRFRWIKQWMTVKKVTRSGPTSSPQRLAIETEEGGSFLFPVGHFVAAESRMPDGDG